jgi:hypothetical protein
MACVAAFTDHKIRLCANDLHGYIKNAQKQALQQWPAQLQHLAAENVRQSKRQNAQRSAAQQEKPSKEGHYLHQGDCFRPCRSAILEDWKF